MTHKTSPHGDLRDHPGPIEVWLSKKNIQVTCTVALDDESTQPQDIQSLSMRGAQREITGWLISLGWEPVLRWEITDQGDGEHLETMRRFRRAGQQSGQKTRLRYAKEIEAAHADPDWPLGPEQDKEKP